eukprot:SAG11_NODE_23331_length_390_cov_5.113402_1_plen_86_part_01
MDDDTSHPFLLLWPEVYLLICSLVDSASRRGGELSTDLELGEVPESIVFKDAKWAETEGKLNSEEFDNNPTESVLFYMTRHTVSTP